MAGVSNFMHDAVGNMNAEQFSEFTDTDSYSSASSCTSLSEEEFEPTWLERVGSSGSLFYIEPDTSNTSSNCNPLDYSVSYDSPIPVKKGAKNKLNAAEKLKKWMKKRRKKVRKSFPLLNLDHLNSNSEEAQTDTIKNVLLDIKYSQQNPTSNSSLCKDLLGLVFKLDYKSDSENELSILEIISHKDVYKSSNIKFGDCLKFINDVTVTLKNINEVLARFASSSTKIKLSFKCVNNSLPSCSENFKQHFENNTVIEELLGNSSLLEESAKMFLHIPHGIFYLSIENELVVEKDGVVYRYPDEETPLLQQKGMFITLAHMIGDVATPPLLNCSVMVQGEVVHVGLVKEDKELMILALPASCMTVSEVQHFATDVAKLFKFQFSSLGRAFCERNARHLNHFFAMFFRRYLSTIASCNNLPLPHLVAILPSVHWIPLPTDLKTELDDVLSELESSDFGSSSKGFYGNQRIFSILGSCLFYKGYLLTNHLPRSDLLDIHLYLLHHQMLALSQTQSFSQVIIWKEAHLTRRQKGFRFTDPEFEEVEGRWFILVVAMGHSILAVLLEAGGCSLKVEGIPAPEPFYVEEVQNTLIILEECGIIDAVEKSFHALLPPLAYPEDFMKEESSTWNSFSSLFGSSINRASSTSNLLKPGNSLSFSSLPGTKKPEGGMFEKPDDLDFRRQQILSTIGPADGESDVESNYSDDSRDLACGQRSSRSHSISTGSTTESFESSDYASSRNQSFRQSFAGSFELSSAHSSFSHDPQMNENAKKIVAGARNTLFHYLHMDPVEGIFLAPPHDDQGSAPHQEVVHNFHRCCLELRAVFERSLRNEEIKKASINPKFGLNDFLQATFEQGVLFQYTAKDSSKHKNSVPTLNFWVIGRLFFAPEPREIYVCYHDSTPQDIVEIAFRLGFGLSL